MGKDFGPIRGGSHAITILSTNETVDVADTNFTIGTVKVISKAIYVGSTGNLTYIPYGQSTAVTLYSVAAGVWHPIAASQIVSATTTADEIVIQCDLTE